MEDVFKEHKLRFEQIIVRSANQGFLIKPCFSVDKVKQIPLKTRVLRMAKRILLKGCVLLVFLAVLIGGSIAVAIYCPACIGYWWLLSFLLGWVCAEIIFN